MTKGQEAIQRRVQRRVFTDAVHRIVDEMTNEELEQCYQLLTLQFPRPHGEAEKKKRQT